MSYTELHTGKLKIYTENFDRRDLQHLMKSEKLRTDDDIEKDDFFFITNDKGDYKYVYNKGVLYKFIDYKEVDASEYIDQTTKQADEIHFTYLFYNGGTCFSEMLEEGLNKI